MVEQKRPQGLPLYNLGYTAAVIAIYGAALYAGHGDGMAGLFLLFFGLPVITVVVGLVGSLLGFVRKRFDPAFSWDEHLSVALGVPMACVAFTIGGVLLFGKGGC